MKDLNTKQKRLLELSRLVRHGIPELGFCMATFRSSGPCGTVACIAGYALAHFDPEYWASPYTRHEGKSEDLEDHARWLLGLTLSEGRKLFYADGGDGCPQQGVFSSVTAEHAARVLEHFALTDKIDWSQ